MHHGPLDKIDVDSQQKRSVIDFCSREKPNTKWRFYKLTKLTEFETTMGCKDAVLSKSRMKNCTNNRLTYEETTRLSFIDNRCPIRAFALHLHGSQRVEVETVKRFNFMKE